MSKEASIVGGISSPPQRCANFSVVIEPPPKRQRLTLASFDTLCGGHETIRDSDSATTRPLSTPEPSSPEPTERNPIARQDKSHLPKKLPGCRKLTTETPQPLTEPYRVQAVCNRIWDSQRDFPKCLACISRQIDSGGCKFASLRAFAIDSQSGGITSLTAPMFVDSAPFLGKRQREAIRSNVIAYSTPGTLADVEFIKSSIASTLTSVLAMELVHEVIFRDTGLTRRRREAGVRPVCDGCATTIFSGHFMCCICGREICLDCYSEWDDSEEIGWNNTDSCSKKRRHTKRQMVPFTLFERGELEKLIKDVKKFPRGKGAKRHEGCTVPRQKHEGYLPYFKVPVDEVTEQEFASLWALGQPIVVSECLKRFQMLWTPDHFIENYGKAKCMLVDCEKDKIITSTVGKFFAEFLSSDLKSPLKLKVCFRRTNSYDRIGHLPMILQKYFQICFLILRMPYHSQDIRDAKGL